MIIPISKELNNGLLAILEINEKDSDFHIDTDILLKYVQNEDKESLINFIDGITKEFPIINVLFGSLKNDLLKNIGKK